jgi:hypothetical protein
MSYFAKTPGTPITPKLMNPNTPLVIPELEALLQRLLALEQRVESSIPMLSRVLDPPSNPLGLSSTVHDQLQSSLFQSPVVDWFPNLVPSLLGPSQRVFTTGPASPPLVSNQDCAALAHILCSLLPASFLIALQEAMQPILLSLDLPNAPPPDLDELAGILGLAQTLISIGLRSTPERASSLLFQLEARLRAFGANASLQLARHTSQSK